MQLAAGTLEAHVLPPKASYSNEDDESHTVCSIHKNVILKICPVWGMSQRSWSDHQSTHES
jgi:hypothetical protein